MMEKYQSAKKKGENLDLKFAIQDFIIKSEK